MRENFHTCLKNLLEDKHITQKELCNLTGLTESTVSRYVNGSRLPSALSLKKIADALDVTPTDLLSPVQTDPNLITYPELLYAFKRLAPGMTKNQKKEIIDIILS